MCVRIDLTSQRSWKRVCVVLLHKIMLYMLNDNDDDLNRMMSWCATLLGNMSTQYFDKMCTAKPRCVHHSTRISGRKHINTVPSPRKWRQKRNSHIDPARNKRINSSNGWHCGGARAKTLRPQTHYYCMPRGARCIVSAAVRESRGVGASNAISGKPPTRSRESRK